MMQEVPDDVRGFCGGRRTGWVNGAGVMRRGSKYAIGDARGGEGARWESAKSWAEGDDSSRTALGKQAREMVLDV